MVSENNGSSAAMGDWTNGRKGIGSIDNHSANFFLKQNEKRRKRLEELRLPVFKVHGPADSLEVIKDSILPEGRVGEKFYVRCVPKDLSLGGRKSIKDVTWKEAESFVRKLPKCEGGYNIEVREYWRPDYVGSIVVDDESRIVMELAKGDAGIGSAGPGELTHASLDLGSGQIGFKWQGALTSVANGKIEESGDLKKEQRIMLAALRYLAPDISRDKLEKIRSIYVEFVFSEKHGFCFIDVASEDGTGDKFFSQLGATKLDPDNPQDYGLRAYKK